MCLIIQTQKQKLISKDLMQAFSARNRDGWGMMWVQNNKMHAMRTADNSLDTLYKAYTDLREYEPVIHVRMKTSGTIEEKNSHPFDCGHGIYFMHNGVFHNVPNDPRHSDTYIFVEHVLKPIFESVKNPHEFIRTKKFYNLMICFIGANNRLIFGDRGGYVRIPDENWHTIENTNTDCVGMIVSNTYAWPAYTYGKPIPHGGLSKKQRKELAKQEKRKKTQQTTALTVVKNPPIPYQTGTDGIPRNALGSKMTHVSNSVWKDEQGLLWVFTGKVFERRKDLDGVPFFQNLKNEIEPSTPKPDGITDPLWEEAFWEDSTVDTKLSILLQPTKKEVEIVEASRVSDEELDARDETFQRMQAMSEDEYAQILVKEWKQMTPAMINTMVYAEPDAAARVLTAVLRA